MSIKMWFEIIENLDRIYVNSINLKVAKNYASFLFLNGQIEFEYVSSCIPFE